METSGAEFVADIKTIAHPFMGVKGWKKRLLNKEQRWQQCEGHAGDEVLSESVAEVAYQIDEFVGVLKATMDSIASVKA